MELKLKIDLLIMGNYMKKEIKVNKKLLMMKIIKPNQI